MPAAFGVDIKTVRKWVERFRSEWPAGLADRSSRPRTLRRPTPLDTQERIIALRRLPLDRPADPSDGRGAPATVSRILKRARLSRIADLEPPESVVRYERETPGELIHIDVKKLGRFEEIGHRITGDRTRQSSSRGRCGGKKWGAGWEFVHVCIDDASRIAFRDTCKALSLKHIGTRPYTPKTNGKAERFVQTSLREWAYAQPYPTSERRAAELPLWLHRYDWHRPHGGIKLQTPIGRLGLTEHNLLSIHS